MRGNYENNPFQGLYEKMICEMTATDFEKYCLEILNAYAEKEQLQHFKITHDKKIKTNDGTYQIDIYATFSALHCDFIVLAECKKYKKSVERKVVSELHDKLNSINAHKGIIISTAGFQKGAIEYAQAHGIALIQVFDKMLRFITNSAICDEEEYEELKKIKNFQYRYYPDYFAMIIDKNGIPESTVYPTTKMNNEIKEKVKKDLEMYRQEQGDKNA